jgi:hypothetical protein
MDEKHITGKVTIQHQNALAPWAVTFTLSFDGRVFVTHTRSYSNLSELCDFIEDELGGSQRMINDPRLRRLMIALTVSQDEEELPF